MTTYEPHDSTDDSTSCEPEHATDVPGVPIPKLGEATGEAESQVHELGRYLIMGTLGSGGMGVVFDAFDPTLDRRVALKVLRDELDERHTTRLLREAQAMAKLSHPNVVQVYEVGEVDGQSFVAMELVRGQTLRQWMRQSPRPSWRECVRMFAEVGKGLAAAHAQGLVHRDFKPGNAIIGGDDGRVRVLDFGLARQVDEVLEEADARDDRSWSSSARTHREEGGSLDESLTATGAVLGTPAYMPPEQMRGAEADARSDQFSFCVSLHEAVYGERPFDGGSVPALMMSMQHGDVRPPPKGSAAPAKLHTVLKRGLAPERDARWSSMEELLTQLRALVAPRRRRWALGGGIALGLGLLGAGMAYQADMGQRCTGARAQLEGVWDDARRQQVRAAIIGTGRSYASETWERVQPWVDEYADAWADKHTEICEATVVRKEQSDDVRDLRLSCLGRRHAELRAAVDVLAEADGDAVENAVQLVAELPEVDLCDDVGWLEQLEQRVPPPEEPQAAEQVDALRERLTIVAAMKTAGQYGSGLTQAEQILEEAGALDYGPLQAEAEYWWGELLTKNGRYSEAAQALEQAHARALRLGHDAVVLDATQSLTFVVGRWLSRHAEGLTWAKTAVPLAEYTGRGTERAVSQSNLGVVFDGQGDYEQAKLHHQRALRLLEETLGEDHPGVAASLNNLGIVLSSLGEYEAAERHHERALRIREGVLGANHPSVAASLNNLGTVLNRQARYEQAQHHWERALRIREGALGADHPLVVATLTNLGNVFIHQGDDQQASLHLERALRIAETTLGADHPDVAPSLTNLGGVFYRKGDSEAAARYFERALRIQEKALGVDHPEVASSLTNLGSVLYDRGQYERAKLHHQRALRIREKAQGSDHPGVATCLTNLGNVLSRQGEYEQAKLHHQRALQIMEKALGPDHPNVAVALINLGEVLGHLTEVEQAKLHYERARAIFEAALGADHPIVAYALVGLAQTALAQRDHATARALGERAVSMREAGTSSPEDLADARFVLARSMWSTPTLRPRARALAQQARDALAENRDGREDELAEVEAWLAEHRMR